MPADRFCRFDLRGAGHGLAVVLLAVMTSQFVTPASHSASAQSDAEHQQFLFAYRLLQRGDLAEAAEEFDEYLGSFPNGDKLGDAQYYRALLHRKNGDNAQAAAMLAQAAEPTLVPEYAVGLLHGQTLSDLGQYEDALAALEQIDVDELAPSVAVSALYMRGLAYRGADNLQAAATALADAAALDTPMRARALLDLAKVQALMNEPDAAVQSLDQCLAQDHSDTTPEAARFAGDITYNQRQFDQAIAYYGQVVARHQSSTHFSPAVVGTLWAQFGAKRYNDLLTTFGRFSQALPVQDRLAAWYLAGSAYQELGDHDNASQVFGQIAGGDGALPIQEKVLYKLAISQFHLDQRQAMDQTIAALTRRFPESSLKVDLAFLQATADARAGHIERGAARLTEFVNRGAEEPYYKQALLRRAHLYETHGQLAAAAQDYRQYLAAIDQPTAVSIQATFRLMELSSSAGEHDAVRSLAQGVLAIDSAELRTPEIEQEAMYRLAVALRYLGQIEAALTTHDRLAQAHPLNPYREESAFECGLMRMKIGDAQRGLPLLLASSDASGLSESSRIAAMRIIAQYDEDQDRLPQALAMRQKLEDTAGFDALEPHELFWIGRYLLAQGQAEQALGYLDAIEEGPLAEHAMLLRGTAQRLIGQ